MTEQEKIAALISGGLSDKEKSEILHKISLDDGAGEEFRHQLNIHRAVKKNAGKIKAPRDIKSAVMDKTVYKNRYIHPVFSYILGGIGGLSLILLLFVFGAGTSDEAGTGENIVKNSTSSSANVNDKSVINKDLSGFEKKDVPLTVSSVPDENNNAKSGADVFHSDLRTDNNKLDKIENLSENNNIKPIILGSEPHFSRSEQQISGNGSLNPMNLQPIAFNSIEGSSKISDKFVVEVSSNSDFHFPAATIEPADKMQLINTSFALSYNFSGNFWITGDYRRENFFQVFSGIDPNDGLLKEYKQQPNFNMFGIFLKYRDEIVGGLSYSVQTGASFSGPGIAGRLRLGLDYSITDNFGLSFSSEYGRLYFVHQDQYFSAQKLGLHYGIFYRF